MSELSDVETQNLAALAASIAPPRGKTGHQAAFEAEEIEIGPMPSGEDDEAVDRLLSMFNETRARRTDEAIVAPLRKPIEAHYARLAARGWNLLWECLGRERELLEAEHVPRRWERDVEALDRHIDWVVTKNLPYRTRQTNQQAARTLRSWEEAQRMLDSEEAIDDPLRMIPTLLSNHGVSGIVVRVDGENYEQGEKMKVRRPLVVIRTAERCTVPEGKSLWWTRGPRGNENTH